MMRKARGFARAFNTNWVLFVFQTIIKEIKFIPTHVSSCVLSIIRSAKKKKTKYENINQHVKLDAYLRKINI